MAASFEISPIFDFQYNRPGAPLADIAEVAAVMDVDISHIRSYGQKGYHHAEFKAERDMITARVEETFTPDIFRRKTYQKSEGVFQTRMRGAHLFALATYAEKAADAYANVTLRAEVAVPEEKLWDPSFYTHLENVAFDRRVFCSRRREKSDLPLQEIIFHRTTHLPLQPADSLPVIENIGRQHDILAAVFDGFQAEDAVRAAYGASVGKLAEVQEAALKEHTPFKAAQFVLEALDFHDGYLPRRAVGLR